MNEKVIEQLECQLKLVFEHSQAADKKQQLIFPIITLITTAWVGFLIYLAKVNSIIENIKWIIAISFFIGVALIISLALSIPWYGISKKFKNACYPCNYWTLWKNDLDNGLNNRCKKENHLKCLETMIVVATKRIKAKWILFLINGF